MDFNDEKNIGFPSVHVGIQKNIQLFISNWESMKELESALNTAVVFFSLHTPWTAARKAELTKNDTISSAKSPAISDGGLSHLWHGPSIVIYFGQVSCLEESRPDDPPRPAGCHSATKFPQPPTQSAWAIEKIRLARAEQCRCRRSGRTEAALSRLSHDIFASRPRRNQRGF